MTYLFLGYMAVWTLLFVYLMHISGRAQGLEREVERLKEALGGDRRS